MENADIKKECELMYLKIKSAEARLKELRAMCNHKNTFEGEYSYRVGATQLAEICSDCGQLIKYIK